MLFRKQYILAGAEGTYGTNPTLSEASDAILVSNISFEELVDSIDYQHLSNYLGKKTGSYQNFVMGSKVSFDAEFKGEGAALGVAPEIGVLLRACGMTETIDAGVSVTYTPNSYSIDSANQESISIEFYQDLIMHEINGCRGTFTLSGEAGKQVVNHYDFTGLQVAAVADTQSDITVNGTIPPRLVGAQFTIDSFSACIQSFSLDMGNVIVPRECISSSGNGISHYGITDRNVTMTINPETPAIGTKDFWSKMSSSAEMAISLVIGQSSLNRCTITIPKAIITASPNYVDRNGILAQDITLNLNYSSGDDELTLLFD